jgi:hypothetical protein
MLGEQSKKANAEAHPMDLNHLGFSDILFLQQSRLPKYLFSTQPNIKKPVS